MDQSPLALIVINDHFDYVFLMRTDGDHFLKIPNNTDYVTLGNLLNRSVSVTSVSVCKMGIITVTGL